MFETNARIAQMVESLYGACVSLNRGDILTRETIAEIVQVEPNTAHWQYVVNRVRRRVERDRHISMMPVNEVGFQLLSIQEQIELAQYRERRANRQLRRGERSLKALEGVKGMTVHQRRLRSVNLDGLRSARLKISEELRISAATGRATVALPRPKIAQLQAETLA